MRKVYFLVILFTFSCEAFTQINNASEVYFNFLKDNQNLNYSGTSALYPLQHKYYQAEPEQELLSYYSYYDSICIKLNLNDAEKEMLAKNGFVVTERLMYDKFLLALRNIYFKDLPVMVTTDMMLFALHASYDGILRSLEISLLKPNLIQMLEGMRNSFDELQAKYASYPELSNSLRDVDIYISVPLALLEKTGSPIISENQSAFDTILSNISSEAGYISMPLFSEHERILDFSQFKPRGHYTEDLFYGHEEQLTTYFKAMIWLGRMDFLLTPPPDFDGAPWSEEEILRMNTSALLLDELLDISGMRAKLEQNEKSIDLMVGLSDNLSPSELKVICQSAGIESAADLLDTAKYNRFKTQLIADPGSEQKILSDIFIVDPYSSEPDPLPVSFRLLGRRFIIDSYFFSQLVYDRIIFEGHKVWRPLPSISSLILSFFSLFILLLFRLVAFSSN